MPRLRKTSSVPSVRSDNGTCDNTRGSRLGTPAFNLYSIVIFAVLFTPFEILVTAHRRHELLFDERVDQGFAVVPRGDRDEMQRQMLGRDSKAPSDTSSPSSPLSAITQMMQGERAPARRDNFRMAESFEADVIKHPYADQTPAHHLHVYCHKHNTILTLTRPNGNPIMSIGCGQIGFRKAGRSGFDPAYQLSAHVLSQIKEKGLLMEIKRLEVVFRGFGKGREAFTKVLLGNEGRFIKGLVVRVTDSTRLKFGGTRSRHERRLG
ncbi:hypothetical protein N7460_003760 [Penicillium canescens]|uniref:Translational machinery component n=1 Tax=Penicillium canescens TaxID=5083 RepID=A0AAD6NBZ3_PENCN|nr:hypothetical protein N7460_003760 [Penicillium canescens]